MFTVLKLLICFFSLFQIPDSLFLVVSRQKYSKRLNIFLFIRPKRSDIYTHFSHKLGLIRNLFFINKKEFTIINFLLTFQVFESKLQFVARYFSLWILRTRHSWNVGFEFQRFTKHRCLPIWQSEMACWPEGNYFNSNQCDNYVPQWWVQRWVELVVY